MDEKGSLLEFVSQQSSKLWDQVLTHLSLTLISLVLAILISVPLGILIARKKKFAASVLGITGIMQTIPGIALIGFMIPLFGIGPLPAIIALFVYALLPIVRNTYTGISGVDPFTVECATAMGMTQTQVLLKVQLPLSMPVILAGIRTAAVINVGVATLAAYIAAGGLGEFIFGGIALNNSNMILAGAIPAALLAILLDQLLSILQRVSIKRIKPLITTGVLLALCAFSFLQLPMPLNTPFLAGFTPEFMGRRDGYLGLRDVYNLQLPTVVVSDAIMYQAVDNRKLDIISGSSTDGRVKAFGLKVLSDDKNIFPPYYAAPIIRQEVLESHPELRDVLNSLSGLINDSIMTELNYRVDHLHRLPEDVAREFLSDRKMLRTPRSGSKGNFIIGSKLYGDGYILAAMYALLVDGYTELKAVTKTGLGGTKICFEALLNDQIDMYPEYTGTGLLVILNSPSAVTDSLVGDSRKVYDYVRSEFMKRFSIEWLEPIGFNNTYALMMRKEHANAFKINNISDLATLMAKNKK